MILVAALEQCAVRPIAVVHHLIIEKFLLKIDCPVFTVLKAPVQPETTVVVVREVQGSICAPSVQPFRCMNNIIINLGNIVED